MSDEEETGQVVDVEDADARIDELEDRVDDLEDKLARERAGKANLRKRLEGRIDAARRDGKRDLLRALLPALEDLDRAIEGGLDEDGLRLVREELREVLAGEDVEPIEATGARFDPRYHEAVAAVETDEHPDGTILEEVQRGYTFGDEVLQHSKVTVARPPSDEEE